MTSHLKGRALPPTSDTERADRQIQVEHTTPMTMRETWRALRASLVAVGVDWRWGRRCGYPRCCIAMYCWDRLWSLPPSLTRAVAQGVDGPDPACDWVPCGVF